MRNYKERRTGDVTRKSWLTKIASDASWGFRNLDVLLVGFFSVSIILLCIFAPSSFEVSWKGRVPYLIFIWLVVLETFLSRNEPVKANIDAVPNQARFIAGLTALLIPTAFTLWQFMAGGRDLIVSLGRLLGVPFPAADWPIAFESLVFVCASMLAVWLLQNRDGLRRFKVSLFFIGAVAAFFMVDTFFHFGTVWLLQLFVPPIASLAAFFLNVLGYSTTATPYADGYLLLLRKSGGYNVNLLVYWPCAGVHSLIIYTFVILLFFKNTEISSRRKIVYVVVGAMGTFMVNILRIVSIGIIGVNTGPEALRLFHRYYGELFFVVWTVVYLVAVFLYESRHRAKQHLFRKRKFGGLREAPSTVEEAEIPGSH